MRRLLLAVLLAAGACRGEVSDPGYDLLPLAAGQSWVMSDEAGRVTTFAVLDGDRPDTVRLRITKSEADAYWWAGVAGARVDFHLRREGGTWSSPRSDVEAAGRAVTLTVEALDGMPPPYRLFPPGGKPGVIETAYDLRESCGRAECPTTRVTWRSTTYRTTLPRWGPVVASHYCEGPACAAAEETWFFAPGIGLVRIHDVHAGERTLERR